MKKFLKMDHKKVIKFTNSLLIFNFKFKHGNPQKSVKKYMNFYMQRNKKFLRQSNFILKSSKKSRKTYALPRKAM